MRTGDLSVLVITAQPGHKLRALQAGAKDFISKPFDLVEVKTRIHNMLEVRLLDLMELIDLTVKADEGFAARHKVRLQVVAAQPGAKVHADPERLAQVMTNLISNACKFSPPGSTVDIAVTREGGRLKVAVADNGPGIADEFLARIFQRFSQADSCDARQRVTRPDTRRTPPFGFSMMLVLARRRMSAGVSCRRLFAGPFRGDPASATATALARQSIR